MSQTIKVLMLLDNPFTNDRRVQREAETLAKAGYDISLVCTKAKNLPDEEVINGVKIFRVFDQPALFDVKNKSYPKTVAAYLVEKFKFDVLHTHDREMLHLARYIHKIKSGFIFNIKKGRLVKKSENFYTINYFFIWKILSFSTNQRNIISLCYRIP